MKESEDLTTAVKKKSEDLAPKRRGKKKANQRQIKKTGGKEIKGLQKKKLQG